MYWVSVGTASPRRGAAAPAMWKVRQTDGVAWTLHGEGVGEDLAVEDVQPRSVEQEGVDGEASLDDLQVGQLEAHRVAPGAGEAAVVRPASC